MKAAIYARRSTDEHQAESLNVQTQEAKRYIVGKGWTVAEEHIFTDDAISRAEFKKRPSLLAMLNAAARGDFEMVVVRDETRLGGDMYRTGLVIQDLIDAGVRLFYYFTDEEITLDGAVDKFLIAARNFAAELEREKTAQRTREHLLLKARRGLNVGGRVFGYDNIEVIEGGRRVRVEYRINEVEAAIIIEIFRRYAAGEGLRAIVKDLNDRRIPPPRAGKRGTGSWSPGAVHAMLRRERYRGVLLWGREGKAYKGGTRVRVDRPAADWVRVEAPELRIIDEQLWEAVQARTSNRKRPNGRSTVGRKPRFMLSGLSKCSECSGPIQVTNRKWGQSNIKVYVCAWHRTRGEAVCTNSFARPVDAVDGAVIEWIQENLLQERMVLVALKKLRARLEQRARTSHHEIPKLEAEARKLKTEIDRLTNALVSTDDKPEAVVKAMALREKRLTMLRGQIVALRFQPERRAVRGFEPGTGGPEATAGVQGPAG